MTITSGQRIRHFRKLNGLSQLKLGRMLYEGQGLGQNAIQLRISRLEASETVDLHTRGKLAKIFGCSLVELLPEGEDTSTAPAGEPSAGQQFLKLRKELLEIMPELEKNINKLNELPDLASGGHLRKMLGELFFGWGHEVLTPLQSPEDDNNGDTASLRARCGLSK
jgi:transcriptional regulator with XRE-family HTH domain